MQTHLMRRFGGVLVAAPCLLGALVGVESVVAQNRAPAKPKVIEIYRGTVRQEIPVGPAATPAPAAVSPAPKRPDVKLPPAAGAVAEQLIGQSTDVFQRGLMPLQDHLNQMQVAHEVELRLAVASGDKRKIEDVARSLVTRYEDVAERLEAFRQPAAVGWQGDVYMAHIALAEAKWELARLRKDVGAENEAKQEFSEYALKHLQQRKIDVDMGLASLPTMATAVTLLTRAEGADNAAGPGQAEEYRQFVLFCTETWNRDVAGSNNSTVPDPAGGIGRIDELQQALVEAGKTQAKISFLTRDSAGFRDAVLQADQAAHDMLESRMEFYGKGTSSLAEVTQAWLLRTRVQELADGVDGLITPDMDRSRREELKSISEMAGSIEDLRGRNTPDVSFVELLALADSADALTRPVVLPKGPPVPRIAE